MYLKLVWRNIWRNKRRSLITIASVFFAVIFAVLMRSMQLGTYDLMIKNVVGYYTGYLQIHQKGYSDEETLNNAMKYDSLLVDKIRNIEDVQAVVPRLESFALASHQELTRGTMVVGIHPPAEEYIMELKDKLIAGKLIDPNDKNVLVSSGLADYFGLSLSDTLVLLGQGYHGVSAAGKYSIKGIVEFSSPELNRQMVLLPIKEAQQLYGTGNRLSALAITVKDPDYVRPVKEKIKNLTQSGNYEVLDWKEMMPGLVQGIEVDSAGGIIMLLVLYLVISFGMFGTVLMMTAERQYEFGVLISIGMKRGKLALVLFLETVTISFMGVMAGIIGAAPLVFYFNRNPIELTGSTADAIKEYGFEAVIPFSTDPEIALINGGFVLAIALLTSLYPIIKIQKLKPVKAMRN